MPTTFEDYIKGAVAFSIPDLAVNNIRIKRSVTLGQDILELSKQTLELAYADALIYGAGLPKTTTGVKDADGGWSHTEGNVTISDKDKSYFRSQAFGIYAKYGEPTPSNIGITLGNLNGQAYRK